MCVLIEVLDVVGHRAVGRDTVEVEQLAAELVADLRDVRPEPVAGERRRADDEDLRRSAAGARLRRAGDLDEPPDRSRDVCARAA